MTMTATGAVICTADVSITCATAKKGDATKTVTVVDRRIAACVPMEGGNARVQAAGTAGARSMSHVDTRKSAGIACRLTSGQT